ncbi:hypothetical protein KSF78_0004611 [Schistosoma japonicum]|nr:hypothetical protein KSF78_0004611 [Schistosoma japonicum]
MLHRALHFPFSLIKILMFWNIHVSGYLRCDNGYFNNINYDTISSSDYLVHSNFKSTFMQKLYIVKLVDMLILNSFAYFHQILIKYMPHVVLNVETINSTCDSVFNRVTEENSRLSCQINVVVFSKLT